mmetsp:Transcript_72662/g.121222  ORF Transcript_72662/g.121222 Transcript_72662/m.121222 type:complete len:201 (-) Transcript_72662:594-1196(-)
MRLLWNCCLHRRCRRRFQSQSLLRHEHHRYHRHHHTHPPHCYYQHYHHTHLACLIHHHHRYHYHHYHCHHCHHHRRNVRRHLPCCHCHQHRRLHLQRHHHPSPRPHHNYRHQFPKPQLDSLAPSWSLTLILRPSLEAEPHSRPGLRQRLHRQLAFLSLRRTAKSSSYRLPWVQSQLCSTLRRSSSTALIASCATQSKQED